MAEELQHGLDEQRIVRSLRRQVMSGELAEGVSLPSMRQLVGQTQVGEFRVRQAMKRIEREGWAQRRVEGGKLWIMPDAKERILACQVNEPYPIIYLLVPLHQRLGLDYQFSPLTQGFISVFGNCTFRQMFVEPDAELDQVKQLLQQGLHSPCEVAYLLTGMSDAIKQLFSFSGQPCLILGHAEPGLNLPCLYEDMNNVGFMAAALLATTDPMVVLCGEELVGAEINIIDGASRAWMQMGRDAFKWDSFYVRLPRERRGYEIRIDELMTGTYAPRGIFALRPEYAMSVIKIAHRRQIRIPKDLQVVGYHHSPLYELVEPEISSISMRSLEEVGRRCGEILAKAMGRRHEFAPRELVESTVIERASTLRGQSQMHSTQCASVTNTSARTAAV